MGITLREINKDNWKECIALQVGDEQKTFVVANVYSLAEAGFYPAYQPLAVYHGNMMVGFIMYGKDPDDGCYRILRLMIDRKYQRMGYGKAAMHEVIRLLKEKPDCDSISISHVPENVIADKLYSSLGFCETGEVIGGETVERLVVRHNDEKG
ncbi:MAG: GNAT family N-acetyltransferase [Dehalococcoidales bacterium]|jgi:diamine N-acetyltransferase